MPGVGDLVTNFVVNSDPAVRGFAGVTRSANAFQQTATRVSSSAGRSRMAITEFSRGFEDFAVSASTGGIAAGMRGATNNINAFLTTLGPLGGIGALAVTAGTVLVGYFEKVGKSARDAKKEVLDFGGAIAPLMQDAQAQAALTTKLQKSNSTTELAKGASSARDRMKEIEAQNRLLEKQKDVQDQIVRMNSAPGGDKELAAESAKNIVELSKQRNDLGREYARLSREVQQTEKRSNELYYQQQREGFRQVYDARKKAETGAVVARYELERKYIQGVEDYRKERTQQSIGEAGKLFLGAMKQLSPESFKRQQALQDILTQRGQIAGLSLPQQLKNQLTAAVTSAGLSQLNAGESPLKNNNPFAQSIEKGSAESFRVAFESSFKGQQDGKEKREEENQRLFRSIDSSLRKLSENATETVSIGGA